MAIKEASGSLQAAAGTPTNERLKVSFVWLVLFVLLVNYMLAPLNVITNRLCGYTFVISLISSNLSYYNIFDDPFQKCSMQYN